MTPARHGRLRLAPVAATSIPMPPPFATCTAGAMAPQPAANWERGGGLGAKLASGA